MFQPVFSLHGDSPSLLGTSDSTGSEAYSGSSQCTSRHTVTFSSTSEHGMGITTSNVQCISLLWGRPHLDLFATSLSHKLYTFVSPVPDPLAYAMDAMSTSWKGMFSYAFPPFRFLSQVLQKVARESCKINLFAPAWPQQAWFTDLLCLLCMTTSSSSQSESTVSAERKNNASNFREPVSARMVTLRKGIRQKGFSVGAHTATNHISKAVRQSTEIVYDAKWSIFINWCVGREIDLIKVSAEQLGYFVCTSF